MVQLYCGDCLKEMEKVPDHSVDLIFTDLPYGTTHNAWDKRIPLEPLWTQYKRIVKIGGAVLLFAQQPFATDLIVSNRKWFRYEWIWQKTMPTGFLNANRMPLRAHEEILVFYEHLPKYNPQKTKGKHYFSKKQADRCGAYGHMGKSVLNSDTRYPTDTIKFRNPAVKSHPTEKPQDLLEYMLKTYTDEGDTVLDSCMGTGSCGIACQHLHRNFIGIEKDADYFKIAQQRIAEAADN